MNFRYKKTIFLALLLALALVAYANISADSGEAKVIFLNVGQGDSVLVTLPGSVQILTDGGPTREIASSLGKYVPFYDRKIELVILTHPHADHTTGINTVLERYDVENIMLTGVSYDSGTYKKFLDLVKKEGANVYVARAGDEVHWSGQKIISVLSPQEFIAGSTVSDVNQTSIVTELTLGGLKFLLQGDAETQIEQQIIDKKLASDIDVLKVSHSGSRGGTSPQFLAKTLPETAVISVGKNSYGHPAAEVVERLERLGSKVLRTDEEGDIVWTFKVR